MGSSGTTFSLSSLMCEEGEDSFFEAEDEHAGIDSLDNPCFVFEDDEEEYIEFLFGQEMGFGSHNHFLSSDDYSSRYWLRSARMDAIDWIFNTQARFGFKIQTAYLSVTYFDRFLSKRSIDESKPWAIQLLSVASLSLAAKMEEQKVPPLSEYPIAEYRFENKVIKNMELLILCTLEWKMGSATPFSYLHYFVSKFCPGSRPETIITKATEHIVAMVKDVNLMDQRPSIIASAAILAAFDATLTRKAMDLRISVISSWGNLESGHVFSCYSLIQEKRRNNVKTPSSILLSTQTGSTCVLENPSETSFGAKRKLTFEDSEFCPEQKLHRP
ncbi:cyclin-D5-1-like [Gastrolobium bilobum]|uniref:cyclin-D5-1-like n=1 Tax=Gastrolobium bilobum TaxID=150636 RepID=UPI002AB30432|nr:cyclin-D5-1-like [Gastrolobium bilobum]